MSNNEQTLETQTMNRDKIIVNTSIACIFINFLLAGFKVFTGLLSNSIAFILDGVNNISDGLASLVTIIGTKLASKLPDKKHPLGHGRLEYLSALVVAALVLYAGITAGLESAKKIINPQAAQYTKLSILVMAIAVVTKLIMGQIVKITGKKVNSTALYASGEDALYDAILSFSVLVCALLYVFFNISLEAWIGILISAFIIKSGLSMIKETVDDILGKRADKETTIKIKKLLSQEPGVRGAYDLIINNYGPDKNYASVHLELPDTMTVAEVDELTRRAEAKVFKETGIILTGVGVYSYNTQNNEASKIRDNVWNTIKSHNWALQMHGFFVDQKEKNMRFDVVCSFDISSSQAAKIIHEEVKELYPDYEITITPDVDISD